MRMIAFLFLFHLCFAENLDTFQNPSNSHAVCSLERESVLKNLSKKPIYFAVGSAFGVLSDLSQLGWLTCKLLPETSSISNEFLLLHQLSSSIANRAFSQIFKDFYFDTLSSWQKNELLLSQVPTFSTENLRLVRFLQNRWLAKTAGLSSVGVNWVYPCFDINVQSHPLTNQSYARLLTSGLSRTYENRIEIWKQLLPHPHYFPLILTRPANLQEYLPDHFDIFELDTIPKVIEQIAKRMSSDPSTVTIDVTHLFSADWSKDWGAFTDSFTLSCKESHVDIEKIACIQRLDPSNTGGIRILHLPGQSKAALENQHQFLLDWVSCFGLTANRVELDRWPLLNDFLSFAFLRVENLGSSRQSQIEESATFDLRNDFLFLLNCCEKRPLPSHYALMLQGTLQILKGLFTHLPEDKWNEISRCPTRSSIVQLAMTKIGEQLKLLEDLKSDVSFFTFASHFEQIHADFSSLLEIFSPFHSEQFPAIYQNLLPIPSELKLLTSCGIHSSAMTSLAGVIKAVEKTARRRPRALYGENTYFECIHAIKKTTDATAIDQATEMDWEQTDLVLAQFNPVLRLDLHAGYKTENIAEVLHRCLKKRQNIPLTLALDCTIDFIDSPRAAALLNEFQQEIQEGQLNVVGYRSGNKYDLFGMDNYCGAPFFMIHNEDSKWGFFNTLCTDPVLRTDPLSLNWFCLSYLCAAPQLDLYRKQIFENTRTLLDKAPKRMLQNPAAKYRLSPFSSEVDAAFIDIKIAGPLHMIRGPALAAGTLYVKSLESNNPLFNRPSLGFYHPNLIMLCNEDNTTLRLTLGLDPTQIDVFVKCLETLDSLNGL